MLFSCSPASAPAVSPSGPYPLPGLGTIHQPRNGAGMMGLGQCGSCSGLEREGAGAGAEGWLGTGAEDTSTPSTLSLVMGNSS